MSFNPPHLLDSSGSLTPAALIPFCAYQTDMTLLGQTRQDLPFIACDKFKPTVLEGQLCYSLNLSLHSPNKTNSGLDSELLMILDPGMTEAERYIKENFTTSSTFFSLKHFSNDDTSARIHLNTLASFTSSKAGKYSMSVLKKMTGSLNFLQLPELDKQCQIGTYEACQSRRYLEEIQAKCGCLPWSFHSAATIKVSCKTRVTFIKFFSPGCSSLPNRNL